MRTPAHESFQGQILRLTVWSVAACWYRISNSLANGMIVEEIYEPSMSMLCEATLLLVSMSYKLLDFYGRILGRALHQE